MLIGCRLQVNGFAFCLFLSSSSEILQNLPLFHIAAAGSFVLGWLLRDMKIELIYLNPAEKEKISQLWKLASFFRINQPPSLRLTKDK